MTLVKCTECGRDISSNATSCPHCGNPMRQSEPQKIRTSEDSFTKRSRGCGDLILYGPIILIAIYLVSAICKSVAR